MTPEPHIYPALSSQALTSLLSCFFIPGLTVTFSPYLPSPSLRDYGLEMEKPADKPAKRPPNNKLYSSFWAQTSWGLSLWKRFHQDSLYQPLLMVLWSVEGLGQAGKVGFSLRGRHCTGTPECSMCS